jgi:phosphocarrier protein
MKKGVRGMKQFEYVITDEVGIHARPAGLLVKAAKEFTSNVTITCEGKSADAKKLITLMGLGVKKGQNVTVTVEGDDEETAAAGLEAFFKENL